MASSLDPDTHRFVDLVAADHTPWYRKPNLTRLYIFLIPAAMGVEWTSGFDGSIMNGLQAVQTWDNCPYLPASSTFLTPLQISTNPAAPSSE
jgi:hypothetical protein